VQEAETDLESLLDEGRLAGIFCRLNAARFNGRMSVEHADDTTVFTLVGGRPWLAEASTPGDSVADGWLKTGLISKPQYAKIVSRMTESLVDSEDMVFCREAVALGAISQQQVDEELSRRVRAKVVQSIGWQDCYVELEEDPELVDDNDRAGEPVGALILTGIRTFYFEQELARELGKLQYARLTMAASAVAGFFELDAADRRAVEALDGRKPFAQIARRLGTDEFALSQLLCALNYAGCVELASQAFAHASALDSSGVLETGQRKAAAPAESGKSPPPQPAASGRAASPAPARTDALSDKLKAYMDDAPAAGRGTGERGQITNRATQSQTDRSTSYRSRVDSRAPPTAQPGAGAQASSSAPPRRESVANGPARAPARPVRERATRKLGAIQRLGKELQNRRDPSQPRVPAPKEPSTALKSLVLARRRAAAQTQAVTPRTVDAPDAFRQGMELLRDQQWARAQVLLTQASEAAPENATYRLHMLWASFKAPREPSAEVMNELRNACRDQLQSDDNRGHAYYYLGHMALHAKKDDQAEKFFRKALSRDKNNKDAERHLLILERRREHAAKANKGNKMFGIELTLTRKKADED
jgi:tetratricopeptide (TPR) repeat protein